MRNRKWMAVLLAGVTVLSTGCGLVQEVIRYGLHADNSPVVIETEGAKTELTAPDPQMYSEPVELEAAYEALSGAAMDTGAMMPMPAWNTEEYSYREENGWMSTAASPFSTFAADVDTASYANLRRMILRGEEIPEGAVRIEEMVNYFHYQYEGPKEGEPFGVTTQIAPCPWNPDTQLMLIGLKTQEADLDELPPSNLVFLIDVSGSMDEYNKLPLVQRAFRLIAENLGPRDRVSIVTYASSDEVVLEGASGDKKARITEAVEDLMAGGGTDGSRGIITAYEIAERYFIEGGNNRVILATDGDLNLGVTDESSLTRLIQEKKESGVYLSVLGFGTGNISDTRMEALADNGNGNYSYIDDIAEARRVLVSEMGGTLFTVADDVKLQVEFNPAMIKGYRLIGYENRTMAAEDFADDEKDGGEIGAGHSVTVLYEIAGTGSAQEIPAVSSRYGTETDEAGDTAATDEAAEAGKEAAPAADEWLAVNVRYKEPGGSESSLLVYPVTEDAVSSEMSEDLSWAAGVAQAGMLLSGSAYAGDSSFAQIHDRLSALESVRGDEYREEFLYLLTRLER